MDNKTIIERLHTGGYSCVISNGDDVRTFTKRGVADIYELLQNDRSFLKGASVADKVVGKGAAALMVIGGVKYIYTDVISEAAMALLRKHQIEVAYGKLVPFIENRDKSGSCPLESICLATDSLPELYKLIEGFIEKMKSNKQQ